MPPLSSPKRLLLIGASRGLGLALAKEYLRRGWRVVATERDAHPSKLHDLKESCDGRLRIETVDIDYPAQVSALRARLEPGSFDLLFVNAGVTNDDRETIADVSTEEFVRVMITNALSPVRVIEGIWIRYSLTARSGSCPPDRAALRVRTDLGGPQARLSVEESIPNLANTIDAQAGKAGLQYLDYLGRRVPW
jgi:NAD(P)-dependent dehydrogenase (short-subunit alcohol dehydrogenase family)